MYKYFVCYKYKTKYSPHSADFTKSTLRDFSLRGQPLSIAVLSRQSAQRRAQAKLSAHLGDSQATVSVPVVLGEKHGSGFKICARWQCGKRKIRSVWTVH